MKDTITLKELAAIAVRRGRLAVILALVCAAALGAWRAWGLVRSANSEENSPEQIEERFQEAMEDYETNRENLENQLSKAEAQLESQREYNDNSYLMKIDPYNKAFTTINLAITDVDEGAFQQVFRLEDTPIDFIISKIQSQYVILWNSLDLQASLAYSPRAGMEDRYLRELVTLSPADGGCLTLTASGVSEAQTSALAQAAYGCLLNLQSRISEGSYLHSFTQLSNVAKTSVDTGLEEAQIANLEKVTAYSDSIKDLNKQLEDLEEPEREEAASPLKIALSCVKYAVLGAALGCLLALVWAFVSYLFRSRPETSRQLEEGLSVPFLGSVIKRERLWDRLADRILDERLWKDEAQALAYISASARLHLPASSKVLLASTLPLEEKAVRGPIKALEDGGRTVLLVGGAGRSPKTADALRACDCVVLAERPGTTRWDGVTELAALAGSMGKPVSGFVTV